MTSTEKQELLSMLSQKEADLQTKLQMTQDERRALEATPVTTPHKVWEPEFKGDYVLSITLADTTRDNSPEDLALISAGMAHSSGGSAKRHTEFLVMLHDLHKFAVEHNEGWKPDFKDRDQEKYQIEYSALPSQPGLSVESYTWFYSVLPSFKSRKLAKKAIDTFGDRLKVLFEYYNS